MYKFKPCVLEAFLVNYTPTSRAAFYKGQENAPEGMIFTMRFIELEYWLDGNVSDSNDPFDVYTTSGP